MVEQPQLANADSHRPGQLPDWDGDWPAEWPSRDGLYAMACHIAGDPEEALELQSAVAFKGAAERAKGRTVHHGWFKQVMKHQWIDQLRRRRKHQSVPVDAEREVVICPSATPEEAAMRREAAEQLLLSIERMTPRRKDILNMRYFQGMTVEGISDVLGVSSKTVEREHKTALEILGSLMGSDRDAALPGVALMVAAAELPKKNVARTSAAATSAAYVGPKLATLLAASALLLAVVGVTLVLGLWGEGTAKAGASTIVPEEVGGVGSSDPSVDTESLTPPDGVRTVEGAALLEKGASEGDSTGKGAQLPSGAEDRGTDADAVPGGVRTFTLRLTVDGKPAARWKASPPALDHDVDRPVEEAVTHSFVFNETSDEGVFEFQLPEGPGTWSFYLADDATWTTIWIMDAAPDGGSRDLDLSFGAVELRNPGELVPGLTTQSAILVSNPEASVWVASGAKKVIEGTGAWLYEQVQADEVFLVTMDRSFNPDAWKRHAGPWTVPIGETLVIP